MSIGEKIIAAIEDGKLQSMEDIWGGVKISFKPNAAEQLEAVVEAHIEERVLVRLELDREARRENVEAAFREGYSNGYRHGEDDTSRYEHGGGSTPPATRKSNEDSAWDDYRGEIPKPDEYPAD